MSNFICSECGMTNIDCGGAGYKTPKEIELEKENEKLKKCITELKVRLLDTREARDNATKVANTYLDQNADLSKKVHILNEANMKLENELGQFAEASKKVERLQEQLEEANKTILDQELIIKKLKRRRICDNQKTEARKEHINELIEQVKELKEEIARRGRLINELKSQRKEANEVIKKCKEKIEWQKVILTSYPPQERISDYLYSKVNEYLEKWGVQ